MIKEFTRKFCHLVHRYLRYAPHMNWEMNTPDAATKDGGWATRELGASWCSNVQPDPFNGK